MNWKLKKFQELTVDELYDVLRLRSEVFVVEQNCVFLDMDNIVMKEVNLLHIRCWYPQAKQGNCHLSVV